MKKAIFLSVILEMLLIVPCSAGELEDLKKDVLMLEEKIKNIEERTEGLPYRKRLDAGEREFKRNTFEGFIFSGQMTAIYQTSSLDLLMGDLKNKNSSGNSLSKDEKDSLSHKDGTATFSADLLIEREIGDSGYFQVDIQFANGSGVDAPFQGGAMVNNDVMEDPDHHNQPYIAKAFYEHGIRLTDHYRLIVDIGKYGVNDFFDLGDEVSDQTTEFLNQAICNNGAFDYVQDLQGHGYTYGLRLGLANSWITFDTAVFSSDSYLDNINQKYSILGAIVFTPEFTKEFKGGYQIYVFKNFGEYGRFDSNGNFITKDENAINTSDNVDDSDKTGFGISLNQSLPMGINLFAKYGRQEDDKDVRHYQDMDESYMFGFDIPGKHWFRENDVLGMAYEIGRLTGNHRKAHEKGYTSFFDRSGGIGAGNYDNEGCN